MRSLLAILLLALALPAAIGLAETPDERRAWLAQIVEEPGAEAARERNRALARERIMQLIVDWGAKGLETGRPKLERAVAELVDEAHASILTAMLDFLAREFTRDELRAMIAEGGRPPANAFSLARFKMKMHQLCPGFVDASYGAARAAAEHFYTETAPELWRQGIWFRDAPRQRIVTIKLLLPNPDLTTETCRADLWR